MSIVRIEGIRFPVEVTSVAILRNIGDDTAKHVVKTLALAGGAITTHIKQEQIDVLLADAGIDEIWKKDFRSGAVKEGPLITVLEDWIGRLTPEEQMAILLHEEAHILNGDCDRVMEVVDMGGVFFKVDLEAELAADAYASERVSKTAMLMALIKVIQFMSASFARASGRDGQEIYLELTTEATMAARIAALS